MEWSLKLSLSKDVSADEPKRNNDGRKLACVTKEAETFSDVSR